MTLAGFHHIAAYTALTQERLIPQPSQARHAQDRSPALNRRLLSAIGKEDVKRSFVDSLNPTDLNEETRELIVSMSDQGDYSKQLEIYRDIDITSKSLLETEKSSISFYI